MINYSSGENRGQRARWGFGLCPQHGVWGWWCWLLEKNFGFVCVYFYLGFGIYFWKGE